MANKHRKRCSISVVTRDIQIKTMRYHYTPLRTAQVKNSVYANAGKNAEKLDLSYMLVECKIIQLLWEIIWQFLRN